MAGTGFDLAEPCRLRIAVSVRPPGPGIVVHRTCAAAVRQCARQLAALDHDVQQDDPRYPGWLVPVMLSYTALARARSRLQRQLKALVGGLEAEGLIEPDGVGAALV